ncbi:urease accessory protein UreH domain-containing protein [Desertibacillus haloalkaliphilus]|uniref:urease accessory protein UreH domain-containing protein n=1 Tax=Desertibacillus haloalkaliphilus TaxID=1328930 RepID=UPI001C27B708|nr:sulfite exporter TauE/SafE family protein [Desertibacillus haloalkaliphilus]MBU8906439.1 sulfite exporter TauE/SafE family protein [Desertibacillus haloalkaliphilus]
MYDFFNSISQIFYQPLINLSNATEHLPLLSALILGILAATAPCQFTANIGAITLYGNRSIQKAIPLTEVLFFQLGKMVVFTGLGLFVLILGSEFQRELTVYFPWIRKILGPMLILIGLYLAGVIKANWTIGLKQGFDRKKRRGKWGAFLLGSSFSLGFCPTMFSLFFLILMPLALSSSYGVVLPAVFSIGTSIPLFIAIYLIWTFGLSGTFMKRGRKIGYWIQRIAGILLVIVGIIDTITYWSI